MSSGFVTPIHKVAHTLISWQDCEFHTNWWVISNRKALWRTDGVFQVIRLGLLCGARQTPLHTGTHEHMVHVGRRHSGWGRDREEIPMELDLGTSGLQGHSYW